MPKPINISIFPKFPKSITLYNYIGNWDFLDKDRIAIWGRSGGGSSTLQAMFRYPEIYNTGMSVAPVPDQRLYDAIYQERYMRTYEENKEGFDEGSAINHAENLEGNLLIVQDRKSVV